jgi:thiol-disulfide isomerase/thioredoxin
MNRRVLEALRRPAFTGRRTVFYDDAGDIRSVPEFSGTSNQFAIWYRAPRFSPEYTGKTTMVLLPANRFRRHRWRFCATVVLATVCLAGPLGLTASVTKAQAGTIQFSTGMLDATLRSKYSGKPLVVVFTAGWCPVCRRMRATALKDPKVVATSRHFEWVAVDLDRQPSLAKSYGVKAIPELHVIDAQGRPLAVISGFTSAAELQGQLTQIHERFGADREGKPPAAPIRYEGESSVAVFDLADDYRAQSICFANVGYGPLELPSQSALQGLRLGFVPRTPSTLIRGEKELQVRVTWVNLWVPEEQFQFDYETLQTSALLAYGLTDTVQIEGGIIVQSRFGGAMDSFIQEFHDLFGIDQNGRDQVPRNRFAFDIDPTATQPGVSLTNSDRGIYSTAALVTLQHNVTCGTQNLPAFSYAFTGRYEIRSDDLEGGSPFDLAISVATSKRFSDFYLYGTLGYSTFGREKFRGIELRDTQFSFLAAVEWRAFSTASVMLQYLLTEGLADSPDGLSEFSNEITLGAKWEFIEGTLLEFGLIENIITFTNSPDFGLHLGITTRF